jgi:hypothetical protein
MQAAAITGDPIVATGGKELESPPSVQDLPKLFGVSRAFPPDSVVPRIVAPTGKILVNERTKRSTQA